MPHYNIAAIAESGGIINPTGNTVNQGDSAVFNIIPDGVNLIKDVLVDGISQGPISSYTFRNVNSNHQIRAYFTKRYTINATYSSIPHDSTYGILVPSGNIYLAAGDSLRFDITTKASCEIREVFIDGYSIGKVNEYVFNNVHQDHTIYVSFIKKTHYIGAYILGEEGGGTINPVSLNVFEGENQTFIITSNIYMGDTTHCILDVKVDDISQGPISTYTFYNVTASHNIRVEFVPYQHISANTNTSGGTISPSGNNLKVPTGGSKTFTIIPNPGYAILDVQVDAISQGPINSFTFTNVTQPHYITVYFTPTFTITSSAGTGGRITPSDSVAVKGGDTLKFTITPESGYVISNVFVDEVPQGSLSSYTFSNITANHNISASFEPAPPEQYMITSNWGTGGSISPVGTIIAYQGGSVTYTITPDSEYAISYVTVDGLSLGAIGQYTFSNINENHYINAQFILLSQGQYAIAASAGAGGIINPSGSVGVTEGDSIIFTITPEENYNILEVLVDGVSQGAINSYPFNNITANHTIHAAFSPTATYYTIAGTIRDSDGNPLNEVNVSLSDGSGSDVTGENGYYSLIVSEGWVGFVTPEKNGYQFLPSFRSYEQGITSNLIGQDFSVIIPSKPFHTNLGDILKDPCKVLRNSETQEFWLPNYECVNFRITPSYLGTITSVPYPEGCKYIFTAGNTTETGTLEYSNDNINWNYATKIKVLDHIDVKTHVYFYGGADKRFFIPNGCQVDVVDNNTSQIIGSTAALYEHVIYNNLNNGNVTFKMYAISPYAYVYDSRNNMPYYINFFEKNLAYYSNEDNLVDGILTVYNDNDRSLVPPGATYTQSDIFAAFYITKTIKKGVDKVSQLSGNNPSYIYVDWNVDNPETIPSHYSSNTITLSGQYEADQWDDFVILHEYGHFIMSQFTNTPMGQCPHPHKWLEASNEACAYSEGWATFFSCAVMNSQNLNNRYNGVDSYINVEEAMYVLGSNVEGAVCATLWDIFDNNDDTDDFNDDNVSAGFEPIWDIFENYKYREHSPNNFFEFSIGWYERSNPIIFDLAAAHGVNVCPWTVHMPLYQLTPPYDIIQEAPNYSGAASIQAILGSINVNKTQTEIHTASGATSMADMDVNQADLAIHSFQTPPYSFGKWELNSYSEAAGNLAKWICVDLTPPGPGYPEHAPSMVPFNGTYNQWVIVNGVQCRENAYPDGTERVYGFWTITPGKSSFPPIASSKTYYQYDEFSTHYISMQGKWLAICEPPTELMFEPVSVKPDSIPAESEEDLIQIATNIITNEPGFADNKKIKEVASLAKPGQVISVKKLNSDDSYFIIPFGIKDSVAFMVMLDGKAHYMEALTIPDHPINFKPLNKQKAINILKKNNLTFSQNAITDLVYSPELCFNEFYPALEIKQEQDTFYVLYDDQIKTPRDLEDIKYNSMGMKFPTDYKLEQNYPNPFNPVTNINYSIPKAGKVSLKIYDILGQVMATLVDEYQEQGYYSKEFDGSNLTSGIYLYELKSINFSSVKKMMIVK